MLLAVLHNGFVINFGIPIKHSSATEIAARLLRDDWIKYNH